jgi:hypothetical protein
MTTENTTTYKMPTPEELADMSAAQISEIKKKIPSTHSDYIQLHPEVAELPFGEQFAIWEATVECRDSRILQKAHATAIRQEDPSIVAAENQAQRNNEAGARILQRTGQTIIGETCAECGGPTPCPHEECR